MTILTILRHAKSSWDDSRLADFDRPLNDRGRKAAKRVGRELKKRRIRIDRIIASPAVRVRETLRELAEGYGDTRDVQFERRIYEASAAVLFDLVRSIPNAAHAPLLVGHNPGLHELVLTLTADDDQDLRRRVMSKFPTAAVAVIELPAVRWADVAPGTGRIVELILPRELD
jgi:phosphohistidine phosphatase